MKRTLVIVAAGVVASASMVLTGCETANGHEGAVIGGAGGAAGGALIGSAVAGHGNRGTGALIGGVLGGAAGCRCRRPTPRQEEPASASSAAAVGRDVA